MTFRWREPHLAFLREGFRYFDCHELTLEFNRYFAQNVTDCQVKSALANHQIVSGRPGPRKGAHDLDTAQLAFLAEGYKHFSIRPLTDEFNRYFGTHKTVMQIRSATRNHRLTSGRTGGFLKGHPSWNAGTKGVMKANSGSFKTGHRPRSWVPVGTETTTSRDHYWKVKVAEPNQWAFGHRLTWVKHHGPIPKGKVVVFKDGDRNNWRDINNLQLIDRGVLAQYNKNQCGQLPPELRTSGRLLAEMVVSAGRRTKKTPGVAQ